jgi:hypothetical protein
MPGGVLVRCLYGFGLIAFCLTVKKITARFAGGCWFRSGCSLLGFIQLPGTLPDNRPREILVLNDKNQDTEDEAKEETERIDYHGVSVINFVNFMRYPSIVKGQF